VGRALAIAIFDADLTSVAVSFVSVFGITQCGGRLPSPAWICRFGGGPWSLGSLGLVTASAVTAVHEERVESGARPASVDRVLECLVY
jgi:hypothetical protein